MAIWGRRIVRTVLAAGAAAAPAVSMASPATAATACNGVCEAGEFCLYWGLNLTESVSDFNTGVPVRDLSPHVNWNESHSLASPGAC